FSRGGDYVASCGADRVVRVFEPEANMAQRYYSSPPLPGIVTSVMFHPGGNLVVSGCDDGGVRLHEIAQPKISTLGTFGAPARRPEFSKDGKLVVAASGEKTDNDILGTARVWFIGSKTDGGPKEMLKMAHAAPVTQATFRPVEDENGYVIITCATNGQVRWLHLAHEAYKLAAIADTEGLPLKETHLGAALWASWSADGHWLATAGGGEVIIWEEERTISPPKARLRLTGLDPATSRCEFSPDGKTLATYGGDNFVYLWDISQLPQR
ncbi:MAG: hypothetical protein U0984_16445, partial [Prosthecobacter sp.]|nr:hypothetical protein [Prosthecobacter sp.]